MIKDPGKFEGCNNWIPYYYEIDLNGGADFEYIDENGVFYSIFHVLDEDRKKHNIPANIEAVVFYESDDGFIMDYGVDVKTVKRWFPELCL